VKPRRMVRGVLPFFAVLLCMASCHSGRNGERGIIPGSTCTSEELCNYFTSLAVGSEYIDYDRLCRWESTIFYTVDGAYTDRDIDVIERLCADLNGIEGFPGIYPAENGEEAALTVSFLTQEEIVACFAYGAEAASGENGPVRVEGMAEYTASGETCGILTAKVAVDSGIRDEYRRSAAICEEIVQSLGLGNDSFMYADSIFYEGEGSASYPSALDFDMIRILYSPCIRAGMTIDELCDAVKAALGPDDTDGSRVPEAQKTE